MKKLLLATIIGYVGLSGYSYGQQLPVSQQNYLNLSTLQPAFTGYEEGAIAWGGFRKNMLGFTGAPNTTLLNFNYRNNDHHGFGVNVMTDQAGLMRNNLLNLAYAYRLKIKANNFLSLGFNAGIAENRFDFAAVSVEDHSDIGNLSNNGKMMFNVGVGIAYTNKRLTLGIGLPTAYNSNVIYTYDTTDFNYRLHPTTTYNASYLLDLTSNGKVQLTPAVIVRTQKNQELLNDYVATLSYNKKISLTSGYRSTGTVPVVLMLEVVKNFKVYYGYEVATGQLKNATNGGFEVGIGYKFAMKNGREHRNADKKMQQERDSLFNALQQMNDSLKVKMEELIQLDKVKDTNVILNQEIDSMRLELERLAREAAEKDAALKAAQQKQTISNEVITAIKNEEIKPILKGNNNQPKTKPADANQVNLDEGAGYYVVVESSTNRPELEKDLTEWNQKESATFIIKPANSKWYFIAISHHDNLKNSMAALKIARKKYPKAWVKLQKVEQ